MIGWLANFTKHLSHQRNRDWAPWLSQIKFLQRFWDIWDVQPPSCLGIRFCQKEKVRPTFKHCTPETWCTNLVGVPARCLVQYNVQLCKVLWCTVWLVVNWYLDALCGWNTQMYPVLMHWCALWLMMNSIDDYIAICTAHTLIAWCVFCFSKHYNASVHMLLKIEWRVKKGSVNR